MNAQIHELIRESVVWDNHGCMPLDARAEHFLPQLQRYRDAGVNLVTLNVGFDALPWENTLVVLERFRAWLGARPEEYALIERYSDIARAKEAGKLGVMFDIEGGTALNGDLRMVERYHRLGVRWMLLAYNKNNLLAGGCQDEDGGLTPFGRSVVDEMARVGMVVCCTHTGYRTTLDVMAHSSRPVIFSHSNPLGVWRHRRNVRDEAIKACAATDGVVGLNGIGIFLGRNDATVETFVRHVDYVTQLVGPRHVGIGLDYVFDSQEVVDFVTANPAIFPPEEYGDGHMAMMPPEAIPEIAECLLIRGYRLEDIAGILGGNHLRVARAVWR